MTYDRNAAVQYALAWAQRPNPAYVYFAENDCSNFISQCLRAGGARDDYNPTHPWWYRAGQTSICWSSAGSLYWYIRTRSEGNLFGVKAQTFVVNDYNAYASQIAGRVELGDLIQYRNASGAIKHSTIITGFDANNEPMVCQHTVNAQNISWRKSFPQAIFHHITGIN